MDTLEAIRRRRSIRRYTGDAIPKADLEKEGYGEYLKLFAAK